MNIQLKITFETINKIEEETPAILKKWWEENKDTKHPSVWNNVRNASLDWALFAEDPNMLVFKYFDQDRDEHVIEIPTDYADQVDLRI